MIRPEKVARDLAVAALAALVVGVVLAAAFPCREMRLAPGVYNVSGGNLSARLYCLPCGWSLAYPNGTVVGG